jgi:hypothetical protein
MAQLRLLRGRARSLRSQMRGLGSMIQGSVVYRQMSCGKPNCRCRRGFPHTYLCVTYKDQRKTKTVYVNKAREAEALLLARNYKQHKELLRELTRVNLEILKRPKDD